MLHLFISVLTLAGLGLAALSIKPLRDIARLSSSDELRRCWHALLIAVFFCIAMRATAALVRLTDPVQVSDLLDAIVHCLGPLFLFVIALLFRKTAQDAVQLARLEQAVFADDLTGLENRRCFDQRLRAAMAAAQARGAPLSLVLLDVDHFKQVNDRFGHLAGDAVLRAVAAVLRAAVRPGDTPCRVGGEEFGIIVPGRSAAEMADLVEQIRVSIAAAPMPVATGHAARITVSLGAAALQAGDTAEALFTRADEALYQAKRAGRNRVRLAA